MNKKKKVILQITLCMFMFINVAMAQKNNYLTIKEQGSFAVGGTVATEPGSFDVNNALDSQGQTFHGDHLYAFYQVPLKARNMPLVFLHGAGQSKKTWESTSDGREGFQNIFLRRKFSVYLLDQPRRGEAGRSMVETTIKPNADEQFWFTQFRLGIYPDYFERSRNQSYCCRNPTS